MEKSTSNRNKRWRERQRQKFYIHALKRYASWGTSIRLEDGTIIERALWVDLLKQKWCQAYKSVRVPCSCPLCQGVRYSRLAFKAETRRILDESEM